VLLGYCCAGGISHNAVVEVVLTLMLPALLQATMAPMFNIWHTTLGDDSDMSDFLCPQVVRGCCQHRGFLSVHGCL
jgi:hypothetical protein